MKNVFIATLATAALTGMAAGSITNGDFSNGSIGWGQYGGAEGPYGVGSAFGFANDSDAVVAYGTFGGAPNYSGYTQDISGSWNEGDTISFGGQMYIEGNKALYGANNSAVQLTFWYGDGSAYGFSVAAGTLDSNSLLETVYDFDLDYVLDAGAASAVRISIDFSYVQAEIPAEGVESGAAWATNMYANITPAPGALALLGLAGFAGRRRRG